MAEKASEIPLNADVPAMEVSGLTVKFPVRGGVLGKVQRYFTAVDDVSFMLPQGKILSGIRLRQVDSRKVPGRARADGIGYF